VADLITSLETGGAWVEIIRLSVKPITTPDFPDPTPLARYVRVGNRYTTLHLEAATWHALRRIAREQSRTLDELCTEIVSACAPAATFAQAARYYVFDHIAAQIPDCQLPPELRDLRRHGTGRTIQ
jgi:predicted DNA-binding ribbon-helix-helix protein